MHSDLLSDRRDSGERLCPDSHVMKQTKTSMGALHNFFRWRKCIQYGVRTGFGKGEEKLRDRGRKGVNAGMTCYDQPTKFSQPSESQALL